MSTIGWGPALLFTGAAFVSVLVIAALWNRPKRNRIIRERPWDDPRRDTYRAFDRDFK